MPVVIGGIEASLRRFSHYDYWQDSLKPSILYESGADMLVYGMGEKAPDRIVQIPQTGHPFPSAHQYSADLCTEKKQRNVCHQ